MVYREILESFVFVQDYVTKVESEHLKIRFLTPFQRILPSNPRGSFPVRYLRGRFAKIESSAPGMKLPQKFKSEGSRISSSINSEKAKRRIRPRY